MAIVNNYVNIAKERGCTLTAEQEKKLTEYSIKEKQRAELSDFAARSIAPGIANAIFWGVIGLANTSAKKNYEEIAGKLESHDDKVKCEFAAKKYKTAAKICYGIAAASAGLPIVTTVASETAVSITRHSANKYVESITTTDNNNDETGN